MCRVYSKRSTAPAEYRNAPPSAVLVDRSTDWGNPFTITEENTREDVIAEFEAYAFHMLEKLPDSLEPLKGKDLVCWCAPEPCHADVLLRLANQTLRHFSIRSNRLTHDGFRILLCYGWLLENDTLRLTWTGNQIRDQITGERTRVILATQYQTMDELLTALESQDVRYIRWRDTKQYQYINKR